jgi:hypothetical protein
MIESPVAEACRVPGRNIYIVTYLFTCLFSLVVLMNVLRPICYQRFVITLFTS